MLLVLSGWARETEEFSKEDEAIFEARLILLGLLKERGFLDICM